MRAVGKTDTGRVRASNQDTIYCSIKAVGNLPNLFVVADGMGGGPAGDIASSSLISEITGIVCRDTINQDPICIMRNAIEKANQKLHIISASEEELRGMGSTIVMAVIYDRHMYVANVGDSRLYICNSEITQITKDHSYVEEMVEKGLLTRNCPDYQNKKNIITRAIGPNSNVEVDFFEYDLEDGDKVLLCSDGLTDMLEDSKLQSIINSTDSLEGLADTLVRRANECGGNDNISVVIISADESEDAG